jgi:hypothetical protein
MITASIIISLFTLCAANAFVAQFKVDENTFGDIKGRQIGPAIYEWQDLSH